MSTSFFLLFLSPGEWIVSKKRSGREGKVTKKYVIESRASGALPNSLQRGKATSSRRLALFSNFHFQASAERAQGDKMPVLHTQVAVQSGFG